MPDTSLRYLAMLGMIPRAPQKIAIKTLCEKLEGAGFSAHKRSVERDLHKLAEHFALTCDEARPAGWSWAGKSESVTFPPMSLSTALTYELLAQYLLPVLPRGMRQQMQPVFNEARHTLGMFGSAPIGQWSMKIAVIPNGQPLLAPDVADEVSDVVYDALLHDTQFEADYVSANTGDMRRWAFSPHGIVYRQGVVYLVAAILDYDKVRQFALHRMSNASRLDAPSRILPEFDLARYIHGEHAFEMPAGRDIRVELKVHRWMAGHLRECRLSTDQTITPVRGSNGELERVTATVADTDQLQWWLRSHAASVEVVKPASLRRRMIEDAIGVAALYGVGLAGAGS
ncbi:helix-turn-helix transcriptional regulator [Dokdonella sp. MW10]|uniref:helix-turn-helix transcriptional regulator n=1 Tax=Dokdonella sp. MW10 TaxID=2992926 RepID=UPI003F7F761C